MLPTTSKGIRYSEHERGQARSSPPGKLSRFLLKFRPPSLRSIILSVYPASGAELYSQDDCPSPGRTNGAGVSKSAR